MSDILPTVFHQESVNFFPGKIKRAAEYGAEKRVGCVRSGHVTCYFTEGSREVLVGGVQTQCFLGLSI